MSESESTHVEYRELEQFPGYRFGSDGSVWSRWVAKGSSTGTCGIQIKSVLGSEWKQRKPTVNPASGYCQVQLKTIVDGKVRYKTCRLAPLILAAFVGPRPKGMQACHFPDRDRTNNALSNLRWDTGAANQHDRIFHGTHHLGERQWKAKLTEDRVREIRNKRKAGVPVRQLQREYGISKAGIEAVLSRRTWKHVA